MHFKNRLGQSLEMEEKKRNICMQIYCRLLLAPAYCEQMGVFKELNAADSHLQLRDIFSTCLLKF